MIENRVEHVALDRDESVIIADGQRLNSDEAEALVERMRQVMLDIRWRETLRDFPVGCRISCWYSPDTEVVGHKRATGSRPYHWLLIRSKHDGFGGVSIGAPYAERLDTPAAKLRPVS